MIAKTENAEGVSERAISMGIHLFLQPCSQAASQPFFLIID